MYECYFSAPVPDNKGVCPFSELALLPLPVGITNILKYGIAFFGKQVQIKSVFETL